MGAAQFTTQPERVYATQPHVHDDQIGLLLDPRETDALGAECVFDLVSACSQPARKHFDHVDIAVSD
jgi:hypothetical protein